jgi:sirohydrochlorin ferrochelatase
LCSRATSEHAERATIGGFVKAVRASAQCEVRDIPVDHLPFDPAAPGPRVAVPVALTDHGEEVAVIEATRGSDPDLRIARALGPDWVLAEVCVRRLIDAGAHQRDTIVLGVAGSDDPEAIADYSRAAQFVSAVWGGPVHLGSLAGRDVSLADALDVARAYGRRVVIAPYLLTPGSAFDELRRAGADLVTAPILDGATPDPRLVSLVLERFQEAAEPMTRAG